jgi:hypothetical protein
MAELRGDLSPAQVRTLERKVAEAEARNRELVAQSEQGIKAMAELEDVFRRLQQVPIWREAAFAVACHGGLSGCPGR